MLLDNWIDKTLSPDARRWACFFSSVFLLVAAGTQYGFSIISEDLKKSLDWTQTELNIVGSIGNNGLYILGIPLGYVLDRKGPRPVVLCCFLGIGVGYLLLALTDDGTISETSYIVGSIYMLFVGGGSAAGSVVSITTNTQNFAPEHRGRVTGMLLGVFGLSAFIISQIKYAFYDDKSTLFPYLLFIVLYTTSAAFVAFLFLRNYSNKEIGSPKTEPEISPLVALGGMGGWDLLKELSFWLLILQVFLVSGTGLMFINNIGSVAASKAADEGKTESDIDSLTALLVTMLSIGNCGGRILIGFLSDFTSKKFPSMPKITLIYFSFSLMLIAQALYAFTDLSSSLFILPTICVGLAYGGMFVIATLTLSEQFGLRYFGQNWGTMCLGTAAGGQIMNLVFGLLYDEEAKQQDSSGRDSEDPDCFGTSCYRNAFTIAFAFAALGVCVTTVHILTYKKNLYRHRNMDKDTARQGLLADDDYAPLGH